MPVQTLKLKSTTENLQLIREFVSGEARHAGFSEDDVYKIELAVDEACTNVIKHAYKNDSSKDMDINLIHDQEKFIISIEDSGVEFNKEEYHEPDLANSIKLRKRGGLGIHLIRSFMDNVEFLRTDNKNILRMTKLIKS